MKLFNKVAAIAVGLSLAAGVGAGIVLSERSYTKASAAESVFYTLAPVSTGGNSAPHNSYTAAATATIDGVDWSVTGNSNMVPWRIGGKSIEDTDREVYSETAMGSAISKVDLTVGEASSITVNSLNLIVASDSSYVDVLDTVSGTFAASSTITFVPTSGTEWATEAYYKFVFNVTVSATKNKFVEFTSAVFYRNSSAPTVSVTGVSVNPTSATVKVGKTASLTATVAPSDASNKNVTWSSDNTAVATVDSSGVVTGVDVGSATITATTADGDFTANSTITVSLPDYSDVNVTNAISAANALADNAISEGYYKVTGYVVGITTAYDTSHGNISFTIADAKDGTSVLTCFRVSCTAEVAATILKDAKVSLIGKLEKFVKNSNVTPELVNSLPSQLTILEPGIAQQMHVVTFDEALTVLSGLTEGNPTYDKYTIEAVVTEITFEYKDGKISFNIGKTKTATDVIKVFNLVLSAEDAAKVQVGATIRVTGNLEVYQSTNELVNGESFELISAPVINDWEYVGEYIIKSEGSYTASGATHNFKVEFNGVDTSTNLGDDSDYVFAPKGLKVLTVSASTNAGEYLISYSDGGTTQYLACAAAKKMTVTTDSTDDTAIWTLGLSNGSLVATNATTQDSGKDLVLQYNPNSGAGRFACYSSAQKVASFVAYDKTAKAGAFVESYMHPEIAHNIEDADTGACKDSGSGYYTAAKTAYNLLDAETKTEFAGNNSFANYVARLTAWASANGETFDASAGTFTASASRSLTPFSEPSSAAALVVVVMSAVSVTAIGGFFLLKKKPF